MQSLNYVADSRQFIVVAAGGDGHPARPAPGYLVAFALGASGSAGPASLADFRPAAAAPAARSGAQLFSELGCVACHARPEIAFAGLASHSREQAANLIRNPPSELMPPFRLFDEDANALVSHLLERARAAQAQ